MHGHFTSRIQKICKLSSDESLTVANAMIKACKEAFPCLNRSDFLWNWPTHLTQIWVLIQAETTDNVTDESLTQIWVLRQAETIDKETDESWDIFITWKINSGLVWAARPVLWKKKFGADYEPLLRPVFLSFHGQFFLKIL